MCILADTLQSKSQHSEGQAQYWPIHPTSQYVQQRGELYTQVRQGGDLTRSETLETVFVSGSKPQNQH